jgi:hypothetical protein
MDEADVMIFWSHGSVPNASRPAFHRPTKFVDLGPTHSFSEQVEGMNWPHPLKYVINTRLSGVRVRRVGLLGFSASVAGVSAFLRSADAGIIDTAVAIDGVSCRTAAYPAERGASLGPYTKLGKLAAFGTPPQSDLPSGSRCMVITNSHANGLPGMDPTWRTSREILDRITNNIPFQTDPLPAEVFDDPARHPWTNPAGSHTWPDGTTTTWRRTTYDRPPVEYAVRIGDLYVLSYSLVDPTSIGDHRYQAAVVMPMVLESIVAARWNALEPGSGSCGVV